MSKSTNVIEIYNKIFLWFDEHRNKSLIEKFYLNYLIKNIPNNSKILDVGCGTGDPIAKFFIERKHMVTGIDASKEMIKICQSNFPNSKWYLLDMRDLNLPDSFNVVIAWHSIFHLNKNDQRKALIKLGAHVQDGGFLIFTSGPKEGEVWSDNGGHHLYHASLSTAEYTEILNNIGLKVIFHIVEDPNCGHATVWLAKKN